MGRAWIRHAGHIGRTEPLALSPTSNKSIDVSIEAASRNAPVIKFIVARSISANRVILIELSFRRALQPSNGIATAQSIMHVCSRSL